jgi:hypothetical protein
MQVFGGVDRDHLAQLPRVDPADHLAHDRHRAHDQAHEQRRGRGLGQAARQRQGFILGPHDGLFGEDRAAGPERHRQVFEVKMVGRADHQQVERAAPEQVRHVGARRAHGDAEPGHDRLAHRRRIDIADHLEAPPHLLHRPQHMSDPLAQADDGDPVRFHASDPLMAQRRTIGQPPSRRRDRALMAHGDGCSLRPRRWEEDRCS